MDRLIYQLTKLLYLLPGDLKVQLYSAKVINVYCNHLRPSCKQVFCLTGYTSHKDMSSKPFNFCDLQETRTGYLGPDKALQSLISI